MPSVSEASPTFVMPIPPVIPECIYRESTAFIKPWIPDQVGDDREEGVGDDGGGSVKENETPRRYRSSG